MTEFDPYIQITPTKTVSDPYDPRVASRAAAATRPAEDWGKILGALAPTLTQYRKVQADEERPEQDKKVADILGDEESSAIAKRLHEASKSGELPPGYSPYIVRKLNEGLARKFFREFSGDMDRRLTQFDDPEFTDSPADVLNRIKEAKLSQDYAGMYGTGEFRMVLDPLLEEHNNAYIKAVHLKRSDARLAQAVTQSGDELDQGIEAFILDSSPDAIANLNAELHRIAGSIKELGGVQGSTGNFVLPEGKVQKHLWNAVAARVEAFITAKDLEGAERLLMAAEHMNSRTGKLNYSDPKDPNSDPDRTLKATFAHDFAREITELEAKILAKRKEEEDERSNAKIAHDVGAISRSFAGVVTADPAFNKMLEDLGGDRPSWKVLEAIKEWLSDADRVAGYNSGFPEPLNLGPAVISTTVGLLKSEYKGTQRAREVGNKDAVTRLIVESNLYNTEGTLNEMESRLANFETILRDANLEGTPAGYEALTTAKTRLQDVREKMRTIAITRDRSVLDKQREAGEVLDEAARSILAEINPQYGVDAANQLALPVRYDRAIQEALFHYGSTLDKAAEDAVLNSDIAADNTAGLQQLATDTITNLSNDTLKTGLLPQLEALARAEVDRRKDRPKLPEAGTALSTDAGSWAEIFTTYDESEAQSALRGASAEANNRTEDPNALLETYLNNEHRNEVGQYNRFFSAFIRRVQQEQRSGEAHHGLVIDSVGNLVYRSKHDSLWEGELDGQQAAAMHRNFQQIRALEGFESERRWEVRPLGEGERIFIDLETKLQIDPGLLDPDFFPVTTESDINQSKDVDDALIAEFKAAGNDYDKQQELIEEWERSSATGGVYAKLPPEHQGSPIRFLERQRRLLAVWKDAGTMPIGTFDTDAE
ncbi:MAG: hypothetical protein CL608_34255 [Anaerolineaceae bacterium]|nr:hypothetical protein [Anaerolineaceae bacterium]